MKHKTILVVDDEADLREMLQSIFTRADYTKILTAASGSEKKPCPCSDADGPRRGGGQVFGV